MNIFKFIGAISPNSTKKDPKQNLHNRYSWILKSMDSNQGSRPAPKSSPVDFKEPGIDQDPK
jgi:hypothetical protein